MITEDTKSKNKIDSKNNLTPPSETNLDGSTTQSLFFQDVSKVLMRGSETPYTFDMLYKVKEEYTFKGIGRASYNFFKSEGAVTITNIFSPSFKLFRKSLILNLLTNSIELIIPYMAKLLIDWMLAEHAQGSQGIAIVAATIFLLLFKTFLNGHFLMSYFLLWAQILNTLGVSLILRLSFIAKMLI